jgi:hypothetical protein
MVKYVFAEDHPLKFPNAKTSNPQRIGEELARIARQRGTKLHLLPVDAVWQFAEANPKSALFQVFTWDDRLAKEKCWREEARSICASIRIVADDGGPPTRVYFNVISDGQYAYRRVSDVENTVWLQEALVAGALREIAALKRRLKDIGRVCGLLADVEEVLTEHLAMERAARKPAGARRDPDGEAPRPAAV